MRAIIMIVIFFGLVVAAFLTGHRTGWQQRNQESRPEINTSERTISGLLYQSPPAHYSVVFPEPYTHLDTVEGKAVRPFHRAVFVMNGKDTLGFFPL